MDYRFENLKMDGTVVNNVSMAKSKFSNTKMDGTAFDDVSLKNVAITNSNTDGMTINGISVNEALAEWRKVHAPGNLADRH